jgi:hypothetical protein
MAFGDMAAEIRGSIPKLPYILARTLINRAYRQIRESNLWSFQLFEANWISPPLLNTGKVTTVVGSPNITFNADAIAAIQAAQIAQPYSLITARQFRIASGTIYNIIALDPAFASNGIAVLDRIYADINSSNINAAYQIYQLYYPAQYIDVLSYLTVRNQDMFMYLNTTTTRKMIDAWDPQRTWYQFPTHVVPLGLDLRGQGVTDAAGRSLASGTLGFPLFELWGQPVTGFTYQLYGVRRGSDLDQLTDTLPIQVGEDVVLARARAYAYEWAEANKAANPRDDGPDYKFLMKQTLDVYKDLLVRYRKQDKEFVDNWFSTRQSWAWPSGYGFYNTLAGTAGPYAQA